MTKELVTVPALLPSKEDIDVIQFMVKAAADSKYFDKMGGPAGIMTIALYAREIGLPIMSALMGGLQNIMGKITMSPETMNSLIRQNGHKIEIQQCDTNGCKIKGTRRDTGESYTASFTLEDARRAGLVKSGGGYDKYSEDMCFARCISRLRRRLFPDVASRSYVHGEIGTSFTKIHISKLEPILNSMNKKIEAIKKEETTDPGKPPETPLQ